MGCKTRYPTKSWRHLQRKRNRKEEDKKTKRKDQRKERKSKKSQSTRGCARGGEVRHAIPLLTNEYTRKGKRKRREKERKRQSEIILKM
jgi:hypothetical protein